MDLKHDIKRGTRPGPEEMAPSDLNEEQLRAGRTVTLTGVLVNAFLILLKFLAGKFGHSQALIADAVHSASDLFTDAVVLFGLKIGRKGPDEKHHFGHARIETLSSAVVGLALIATAVYIGAEAGWNVYLHKESHPTGFALTAAFISIVFKEVLYHYTMRVGRRIKSEAIVANAWHHRSDAFSSIAVLMGVAAALINPAWHIMDAYAALFVSFFILKVGFEILWKTLREFTDTAPRPEILKRMKACILKVDGVMEAHDLRVRTSGGFYQVEIHIQVDGRISVQEGHGIAKAVERCLEDEIEDMGQIIVHVDPAVPHEEN
ncbi:MAG: cation diffusion facilitator family transporter [Pseudomonadota bacterium]